MTAYIGFDCTAPSLHVGHLRMIMLLRLLQRTGHRPIVLMGGGTTRIGDPSGKDEARRLLDDAQIAANMAGIRTVFERFLEFGDGPRDAIMANNADWLDELGYIPFLREVGRHFSINRMLGFDSVKLRLERSQPCRSSSSTTWSCRPTISSSLAGATAASCRWADRTSGATSSAASSWAGESTTRVLYGLTTPLLTTADGAKMGKTAAGAVWLDGDLLAPYDYWQFWRNVADADVGRFLRSFTELEDAEIERLEGLAGAELNEAKKVLASEATRLCHGEAAARAAAATARRTFEQGAVAADLPTLDIDRRELETGIPAFELFRRSGTVRQRRRGAAPDPRRRRAHQRCRGRGRAGNGHRRGADRGRGDQALGRPQAPRRRSTREGRRGPALGRAAARPSPPAARAQQEPRRQRRDGEADDEKRSRGQIGRGGDQYARHHRGGTARERPPHVVAAAGGARRARAG